MPKDSGSGDQPRQLLHLVFGGELSNLESLEFADLQALDIVGIYPNYAEAAKAWKAAAQRTVDSAQTRYFVVHLHRLLEPEMALAKPRRKATPAASAIPAKPKPKAEQPARKSPRRATRKGRESA